LNNRFFFRAQTYIDKKGKEKLLHKSGFFQYKLCLWMIQVLKPSQGTNGPTI